jgi:hypothetical protein
VHAILSLLLTIIQTASGLYEGHVERRRREREQEERDEWMRELEQRVAALEARLEKRRL